MVKRFVRVKKVYPNRSRRVDFFGPQYLAQYREELSEARTQKEINFLKEKLGLKRGMKVLDLGCGSGRHVIQLAKIGCLVTGFDKTEFLLKAARKAAGEAGVKVRFIKGDMRRMNFRNEFDAVVCLYTSFGYFEKESDNFLSLKRVTRALKPGGKFFIDMANRDYLVSHFTPRDWRLHKDGSITCHMRAFDPVKSEKTNYQTHILPDGKRQKSEISVRLFSPHELINLCVAAGMKFKSLYGDFDSYHLDSPGIIVVAQRVKR